MLHRLKSIKLIITFLLVANVVLLSQPAIDKSDVNQAINNVQQKLFPIPGSHLLREKEESIQKYFKQYPNVSKLLKPRNAVWNFSVGDHQQWWATNLVTYNEYEVSSTCQAIGDHCYIFVEDALWNNRVTENTVNSIKEAFDNSTPANPSKGIYQIDVETFGEPPDVDLDLRIIILIYAIKYIYRYNDKIIENVYFQKCSFVKKNSEILKQ